MKKILLLHFAIYSTFVIIFNLNSMPEATDGGMPTADVSTTDMPADTAAPMPAETPATPPPPASSTQDAQYQTTSTAPTEEVKPERLGEFEINETQADIVKTKDTKITELYKKSSGLSNQINDAMNEIQKIRDDFFNKFSGINEKLDEFYQRIGIESGKAQEFLKDQK